MTQTLQRLLRLPAVLEICGMGKSQLLAAVDAGTFPKPVNILEGGRARGWLESEILSWQQSRIAARDAENKQPQPRRPLGRPRKHEAVTVGHSE